MQIVIDTIDSDGGCRALIVEPIDCDGIMLIVRRNAQKYRNSALHYRRLEPDRRRNGVASA